MPRYTRDAPDEEDDDWDESDEYDAYRDYDPDEPETYPEGLYDDDGPPLVPCRYCAEEIPEDTERCHHCGNYLTREEMPGEKKPRVWIVLMALALLAAALLMFG